MEPFDLKTTLDSFYVIADTREQDTPRARRRYASMGCDIQRRCLSYGDYAGAVTLPDGSELMGDARVERKMNLDELAQCFTSGRERFTREFERATADGARIYLLVENATWEHLYAGQYRSRFSVPAFVASTLAFMVRYNAGLIFCKEETSGRLIREILFRDIKEKLEHAHDD